MTWKRAMMLIWEGVLWGSMLYATPCTARSGNGGAIAAGVLGGALFGGAVAAAASQQCSPDDPGCYYDPYLNRPYLYAGPVVYGPTPYYWGPAPLYMYGR